MNELFRMNLRLQSACIAVCACISLSVVHTLKAEDQEAEATIVILLDLVNLRESLKVEALTPAVMKQMREWNNQMNALRATSGEPKVRDACMLLNRRMSSMLKAVENYCSEGMDHACRVGVTDYQFYRKAINVKALSPELKVQLERADQFAAEFPPVTPGDEAAAKMELAAKQAEERKLQRLDELAADFAERRQKLIASDAQYTLLRPQAAAAKRDAEALKRQHDTLSVQLAQLRNQLKTLKNEAFTATSKKLDDESKREGAVFLKWSKAEEISRILENQCSSAQNDAFTQCEQLLILRTRPGGEVLFNDPKLQTPVEKKLIQAPRKILVLKSGRREPVVSVTRNRDVYAVIDQLGRPATIGAAEVESVINP